MGGLFSKQKKEVAPSGSSSTGAGKKFYQFWSKEPQQAVTNTSNISEAPIPAKPPTVEWTDVPLLVPDVPDSVIKYIITDVPIPPPRKHRGKSPSLKNVADLGASTKEIKPPRALPQIPVEEPIIVPKKEPVHICDGTHHHVTNIANGKVIHDAHITPNRKTVVAKEILMPKHHLKRPKHLSTVSLPNYEELAVKRNPLKENSQNQNLSKKKPSRHISVTSLPTEGKTFLSSTTAARLENYMLRCKSFGSLPPKQLLEKLQNEMDFASESDDSWEGLDDWDMEVLEHNAIRHSPVVPRSRLSAPTINTSLGSPSDNRLPTTIEEVDEVMKNKVPVTQNKGIISLKKRDGRRESIDDFFDSKAENPVAKVVQLKKENFLGRRGSDGFFGYDKLYPLAHAENNNPNFTPDKFFSSSLLQSEAENTNMDLNKLRRKSAGAALHRIESCDDDDDNARIKSVVKTFDTEDDLLSTFQKFYKNNDKDDIPSTEEKKQSEPENENNKSGTKSEPSIQVPPKVDWSQKFHNNDEKNAPSLTDEKKQQDNESKSKKSETKSQINVPNIPKVDWTQKIRKDDEKVNAASTKMEEKKQSEKIGNENKTDSKVKALPLIGRPITGETGKPSIVEHSNLLKFIQDNAIVKHDIPMADAEGCVVGGIISETLRPGLKDLEDTIKKVDGASKDSLKL